jgi:uncharacterized membrane protein
MTKLKVAFQYFIQFNEGLKYYATTNLFAIRGYRLVTNNILAAGAIILCTAILVYSLRDTDKHGFYG